MIQNVPVSSFSFYKNTGGPYFAYFENIDDPVLQELGKIIDYFEPTFEEVPILKFKWKAFHKTFTSETKLGCHRIMILEEGKEPMNYFDLNMNSIRSLLDMVQQSRLEIFEKMTEEEKAVNVDDFLGKWFARARHVRDKSYSYDSQKEKSRLIFEPSEAEKIIPNLSLKTSKREERVIQFASSNQPYNFPRQFQPPNQDYFSFFPPFRHYYPENPNFIPLPNLNPIYPPIYTRLLPYQYIGINKPQTQNYINLTPLNYPLNLKNSSVPLSPLRSVKSLPKTKFSEKSSILGSLDYSKLGSKSSKKSVYSRLINGKERLKQRSSYGETYQVPEYYDP